jgi:hypothetical protein
MVCCPAREQSVTLMSPEAMHMLGIPMIATTRYDGSRPPIPIDRDQYEGAVGYSW